jgi:hypothetical protein
MKFANGLRVVVEKFEEFVRLQDEKYYADPVEFRRHMDWFFARMVFVFGVLMLILSLWRLK